MLRGDNNMSDLYMDAHILWPEEKIHLPHEIDWSKQHCGVHQASWEDMFYHMPDLAEMVLYTFPEKINDFVWDVKVHMLMPGQWPCIPNWHYDNIPRANNKQDFDLVKPDLPMYLWLSGPPFTEFKRDDGSTYFVEANKWHKFTQKDLHRGHMATDFCWRGFIRATHKGIMPQNKPGHDPLRRHSQVYLDVNNFSW